MSSDVSSATYTLDNSGIIKQFDLENFTSSTIVDVSPGPFFDITSSFPISNYSNYDMVAFNVSAISQYSCEYKSEFFCFKAGA
jgi:hypothetical protein